MANDKKFIAKNGFLTSDAESIFTNSTAATPTVTFTNSGGAGASSLPGSGAVVAKFAGNSDAMVITNVSDGDYFFGNNQQNNGINFYDGTGGMEFFYNGVEKFSIDSNGTTFATGHTTNGTTTTNRLLVEDNGSSSPLVVIKADDQGPWALTIGNDTYSTTELMGHLFYQADAGDVYYQTRGNGVYENWNFQQHNGSTARTQMRIASTGHIELASNHYVLWGVGDTNRPGLLGDNTNKVLQFHNNGAERMRLGGSTSSGYFGIGLAGSDPTSILHLKDSTGPGPTILLEDASGNTQTAKIHFDQSGQNTLTISTQYQSSSDDNLIQFAPADNIAMTIRGGTGSDNGNVGIGSNDPQYKLDVDGITRVTGGLTISPGSSGHTSFELGSRSADPLPAGTGSYDFKPGMRVGSYELGGINAAANIALAWTTDDISASSPGYLAASETYATASWSESFTVTQVAGTRWFVKLKLNDAESGNDPRVAVNNGTEYQLDYADAVNASGEAVNDSDTWHVIDVTDDIVTGSNILKVWLGAGQKTYILAAYVFASTGIALPNEPAESTFYAHDGFGVRDRVIIDKNRDMTNINSVRVIGVEGLRVRSDDAFGEGINSSMIVGDTAGGQNSQGYGYVELHAQDGKWNQLLHYHGGTGVSNNKWRVGSHYNSTNSDDYYRFYARTPAKDMMRLNAQTDSMEVNSYLKVNATTYITGSLQVGGSAGPQHRLDLADGVDTTPQDKLRFGVRNGASSNDSNDLGTGIIWEPRWSNYTKRSAGILQIAEGNYFKSGLAFYTNGTSDGTTDFSERMRIDMDGNVCIGQTAITYTSFDQTPVVGAKTNNKLHVNGSIQLLNNDDAIVFGRGTASFMKDEEIGFGWGGGWYMTDGTYIRGRGSKVVYNQSNNIRTDKSFTTNTDGKDAWGDSSGNGRIAISGADSISVGQNPTIAISGGNGGYALSYMNRIDVGSDHTNNSNRLFDFYADGVSKARLTITANGDIGWYMNTGSALLTLDSGGTEIHAIYGNTSDRRTVMHSPMAKQHNSNGASYPLGHYTPGETVFALDNTWSSKQVQEYFNNGNVQWSNQTDMGGGSLYINGGVSVGGVYNSGFPFIPIENTDYFYGEVWVKNVGNVAHYCGSIDYGYNYNNLGGNPGSYGYWIMANTGRGAGDYRKESAYISGFGNNIGQFETGSKYFTPQALWNYSHYSGTRACYINGWKYIRVYQPGNRYFTGDVTAYYSSDERLKTNINTIEDAVHKIQQLHGVMFDWREETAAIIGKDANKREAGVIAQEVMKVMPELVEQRENGYYAVRYEKLTPLLIEAVKTQSYWIEDQKQMILEKNKTIEDVSNRLDTLEKLMKDILGK